MANKKEFGIYEIVLKSCPCRSNVKIKKYILLLYIIKLVNKPYEILETKLK